ncbi:MAG: RdgB/HAM1 family non-canonical purine NTP pyrophosphatase [Chlamydiota bacterium]
MPSVKKPSSLLIASKNLHKIRETKDILKEVLAIDLFTLRDFPTYAPAEESGGTFEENAILKATQAATELGMPTLADDSGIVVPALQGKPGIFSSRYAGLEATDADNRKKLLLDMEDFLEEDRFAYYHCSIAFSTPDKLQKCSEGKCEGKLLTQERGGDGFGYDPLFVKHEYSKTFSELKESIKNRISHRRKALDKILPFLDAFYS